MPSPLSIVSIGRAARAALVAALLFAAAPAAAQECAPTAPMDQRAQCVLATAAGRRALPTVGQTAPADLEGKRAHAALTPSFARYVLRHADRAAATAALEGASPESFQRHTGRSLAQWRTDWVASLQSASAGG